MPTTGLVFVEEEDPNRITTLASLAPVTSKRPPFVQPEDDQHVPQAGVARADLAPSYDEPHGTAHNGWAARHKNESVLQQHLDFFDQVCLSSPLSVSLLN
jgi:hypothetical protein